MKGIPVEKLVYDQLFPKARPNDPQNFQAFCSRCLIGEVRSETQAFYGHLDTQEAKFPGLDYTKPVHRIRLSRFTWHRRLFRAFDTLGLTPGEIANLTRWEGTKWAKDKYEKEHGIIIRDTTSDGIAVWDDEIGAAVPDPKYQVPEVEDDDDRPITRTEVRANVPRTTVRAHRHEQDNAEEDEEEERTGPPRRARPRLTAEEEDEDEDEASEPELESVGVALNARLREGAARREAGDTNAVLDEEWEQWLKSVIDSGLLNENMSDSAFRQIFEATDLPTGIIPVDVMSAARAGRWTDVPEFLHSFLRATVEAEQRGQLTEATTRAAHIAAAAPSSSRRTHSGHSGLRLPMIQSLASALNPENLTSPRMTETPPA